MNNLASIVEKIQIAHIQNPEYNFKNKNVALLLMSIKESLKEQNELIKRQTEMISIQTELMKSMKLKLVDDNFELV